LWNWALVWISRLKVAPQATCCRSRRFVRRELWSRL